MTRKIIFATLALLLLSACATTAPPPEERHPDDPWEPYNRNMYAFNRTIDKAVVRPVARAYDNVVPSPVKTGVSNFFENLLSLQVIVNLALQGRPGDAGLMFERFLTNTIGGAAGLFDLASHYEMPRFEEDFGQTLAVWGWEESRFLMLPLLGPSTVRDGLAEIPDSYSNIVLRRAINGREWGLALNLIQRRAKLLPREEQLEEAFDEYLFIRDAWLQNRRFRIFGESEAPDYESFLEDDWEDDPQ